MHPLQHSMSHCWSLPGRGMVTLIRHPSPPSHALHTYLIVVKVMRWWKYWQQLPVHLIALPLVPWHWHWSCHCKWIHSSIRFSFPNC